MAAAKTTGALFLATGQTGAISAAVAGAAESALNGMVMSKAKIAVGLLLAAAIVAGGGSIISHAGSHGQRTETRQAEAMRAGAVRGDPAADPLPAHGAVRLGTARYRHGDTIQSMAVSADGKLAVTAGGSSPYTPTYGRMFRRALVFDLTDGRCLYSPAQERGREIEAVGLSPDGKTLAARDDAFLYVWDAATGKELQRLDYRSAGGGGRSPTDWITFTPDGKQVAVTLMGDAIQLIDAATCKVVRTFAPGAAASACVFSPDGKLMATGGYEQEKGVYYARVWDLRAGEELRRFPAGTFPGPANGGKRTLAFSPDGATLAGGGWGTPGSVSGRQPPVRR
jgi:WD40 repeat protein